MADNQSTEFLVLRTTRVGDSKIIANGVTPSSGRLSFMVYGSGSGRRGGVEFGLFRLLQVTYLDNGRELKRCETVEVLADYGGVSRVYERYSAGCWLSRFGLANMLPGLGCPYLFQAMKIGFERLSSGDLLPEAIVTGVILVYLREGGWLSDYEDSPETARQIQALLEMALGGEAPRLTDGNWRELHEWTRALLRLNEECVIPDECGG